MKHSAIKPSMMMKSTNTEFRAIMARRSGTPNGAMISRILKSGKPGKPFFVAYLWNESTVQDVINRMEKQNSGTTYVEA